jgi:hypothetical protein
MTQRQQPVQKELPEKGYTLLFLGNLLVVPYSDDDPAPSHRLRLIRLRPGERVSLTALGSSPFISRSDRFYSGSWLISCGEFNQNRR